jgi:hypothetical protein
MTVEISPQYVTDDLGNRVSVILPMGTFQKILDLLEDLEDVRLYDEVKSRNETKIPLQDYLEKRKLKNS